MLNRDNYSELPDMEPVVYGTDVAIFGGCFAGGLYTVAPASADLFIRIPCDSHAKLGGV